MLCQVELATRLGAIGLAFMLGGCAGLLDIEEATCGEGLDGCEPAKPNGEPAGDLPDAGKDAGPDDDDRTEDLCEIYCAELDDHCSEPERLQYVEGTCQQVCEAYLVPEGIEDGPGDDTLECRIDSARSAAVEKDSCAVAGLSGENVCGEVCEVYCELLQFRCTDIYDVEFSRDSDCEDACKELPRSEEAFNVTIADGNTLDCRFYHLQAAAVSGRKKTVHCEHAAGLKLCVEGAEPGN